MAIIRRDPFREIERWEPFGEMESLHRRMNRLFERLMPSGERFFGLDFMPAAEMDETEDEIHLKLEIPGMEAKDLDIEVSEKGIGKRPLRGLSCSIPLILGTDQQSQQASSCLGEHFLAPIRG